MSLTIKEPRPKVTPPKLSGNLHICHNTPLNENDPFEKIVAMCGVEAHLFLNGDLLPEGFDFYLLGAGHEAATCIECRKAAGLENT